MGEKQATQQQWQIEHNTNSNYSYGTKCATDLLLIAKIVYTLFIVYSIQLECYCNIDDNENE